VASPARAFRARFSELGDASDTVSRRARNHSAGQPNPVLLAARACSAARPAIRDPAARPAAEPRRSIALARGAFAPSGTSPIAVAAKRRSSARSRALQGRGSKPRSSSAARAMSRTARTHRRCVRSSRGFAPRSPTRASA
jgi:hypothetical protein